MTISNLIFLFSFVPYPTSGKWDCHCYITIQFHDLVYLFVKMKGPFALIAYQISEESMTLGDEFCRYPLPGRFVIDYKSIMELTVSVIGENMVPFSDFLLMQFVCFLKTKRDKK